MPTNREQKMSLHTFSMLPALAGLLLLASGSQASLSANVTGGGAVLSVASQSVNDVPVATLEPVPEVLHAAAAQAAVGNAGVQLILGMLLLMIGFAIHALIVMKDDRSVHITKINRPKTSRKHDTAKYLEMYWLEK